MEVGLGVKRHKAFQYVSKDISAIKGEGSMTWPISFRLNGRGV
jgi:hypothetical protein